MPIYTRVGVAGGQAGGRAGGRTGHTSSIYGYYQKTSLHHVLTVKNAKN